VARTVTAADGLPASAGSANLPEGECAPIPPILVDDMVAALSSADVRHVRLDGARHALFRDAPEEAVGAVLEFARARRTADPIT